MTRRSFVHHRLLALSVALAVLLRRRRPRVGHPLRRRLARSRRSVLPAAGNGGYDVRHYSLTLDYDAGAPSILDRPRPDPRARDAEPRPLQPRPARLLHVSAVSVNGRAAARSATRGRSCRSRRARQLQARPPVRRHRRLPGTPEPVVDPDGSIEGWIPTDDGAFVVNEPQGAPGWFPVNDTPRDKATYDFAVTVPAGHTAMANGVLVSRRDNGGHDDLALGGACGRWRPTSPRRRTARSRRASDGCRTGCPSTTRSTPTRASGSTTRRIPPWPGSGSRRRREIVELLLGALRALPVRERRRDRRLGARRPLRARVPDAAELLAHPGSPRPSSTRSPTSGSATRSRSPSGPTSGSTRASRTWSEWIYDERHGGRPRRRRSTSSTRSRRTAKTARTCGSRRPPRCPARRSCSTPPSTTAAR